MRAERGQIVARGHRIHIFGASGSGTSTLGRSLASAIGTQAFDTDDFYWHPTDPPFIHKRDVPERVALMQAMFLPRSDWVLSGSLDSWSEGIAHRFTLAVFLTVDTDIRLERLRARERRRYGADMEEGGSHFEATRGFLNWSAGYDAGLRPGRSRLRHEVWAESLACPVLRLDGHRPVATLVGAVKAALDPVPANA